MEKLLTYIKLIVNILKPALSSHRIGYVGLVGVLSLIVSGFAWLFQLEFGGIAAFFAVIGLLCVLLYLIVDFKHIRSQFSKRSVRCPLIPDRGAAFSFDSVGGASDNSPSGVLPVTGGRIS